MEDSLKRIGEKAGCSVRVSPHVGRHTFATLALSKGMPLETLQKVLGHKTIISTQVYAELINPKIGEDTDRMREDRRDVPPGQLRRRDASPDSLDKHPFFFFFTAGYPAYCL